jgi:hypothetical protein
MDEPTEDESELTGGNEEKTDRSGATVGSNQHCFCAGEVYPARTPQHAAFVVGAATVGSGTGRDLCTDGR